MQYAHIGANTTKVIKCSANKRITINFLYHTHPAANSDCTLNGNILYQTGCMKHVKFDKETNVTIVSGTGGYVYVEWEETN